MAEVLRITTVPGAAGRQELRVEGRLVGPWVDELRRVTASPGAPDRLRIDLSAVTFADAAGVALVRGLVASGAELVAVSPVLEPLLDAGHR